jgi:hypothetical protein
MSRSISTFSEFWPYYLGEHRNPLCRILHFVGTATFIGIAVWVIGTRDPGDLWMVLLAPIPAYGLAWTGHFLIEKNRPATFTYPLWSLLADFRMSGQMLLGRLWTGDLQHIAPGAAD